MIIVFIIPLNWIHLVSSLLENYLVESYSTLHCEQCSVQRPSSATPFIAWRILPSALPLLHPSLREVFWPAPSSGNSLPKLLCVTPSPSRAGPCAVSQGKYPALQKWLFYLPAVLLPVQNCINMATQAFRWQEFPLLCQDWYLAAFCWMNGWDAENSERAACILCKRCYRLLHWITRCTGSRSLRYIPVRPTIPALRSLWSTGPD